MQRSTVIEDNKNPYSNLPIKWLSDLSLRFFPLPFKYSLNYKKIGAEVNLCCVCAWSGSIDWYLSRRARCLLIPAQNILNVTIFAPSLHRAGSRHNNTGMSFAWLHLKPRRAANAASFQPNALICVFLRTDVFKHSPPNHTQKRQKTTLTHPSANRRPPNSEYRVSIWFYSMLPVGNFYEKIIDVSLNYIGFESNLSADVHATFPNFTMKRLNGGLYICVEARIIML